MSKKNQGNKKCASKQPRPVIPIAQDVPISPSSTLPPLWLKKMSITFCETGNTLLVGLICGIERLSEAEQAELKAERAELKSKKAKTKSKKATSKAQKGIPEAQKAIPEARQAIPDVKRIERHLKRGKFSFVIEAGIRLDWASEERCSNFEKVKNFYSNLIPTKYEKKHQGLFLAPHAFIVPILGGALKPDTKIEREDIIDWKTIESTPEFSKTAPNAKRRKQDNLPDEFWTLLTSLPSILRQVRSTKSVKRSTSCKCYGSDGDELSALLQEIKSPKPPELETHQINIGRAFIRMAVTVDVCLSDPELASWQLRLVRDERIDKRRLVELFIWSHLSSHDSLNIGKSDGYTSLISNSFHDSLASEPRTGFICSKADRESYCQNLYQILGTAYQAKGLVHTIKLAQRLGLYYLKDWSTNSPLSAPQTGSGGNSDPAKKQESEFNYREHPWKNRKLLEEALQYPSTTKSELPESMRERFKFLEWLGDSVLELWSHSTIWNLKLKLPENNHLTRNSMLQVVAGSLGIEVVRFETSKDYPLADVVEALIAALYLDDGCNFSTEFEETIVRMFKVLLEPLNVC